MKRMTAVLLLLAALFLLGSCMGREKPSETPAATGDAAPPASSPTAAPEPETGPDITPEPIPTPPPGPDAADLRLARMSREEKAYQMIMLCSSASGDVWRAASMGVGGICLYANAFTGMNSYNVRTLTDGLQASSPIPLLLAVDEEGGTVCRVSLNPLLRNTPFLDPRTLYETGGWQLVESDTEEKSYLLLSLGLNVNLAPVADVPLDRSNYIYPRCFGTDAGETAEYISRVVGVMKRCGVGSTLKHFPGYGGSADTHTGMAYDERPLSAFTEGDFLPFIAGIEAGADAVLVSHNVVECMDGDYPASLSPEVHRILREDLGFQGVILCDDLHMSAIGQFTGWENAAVQAALAGNDLICCSDFEESARALLAAMEDGRLSEEQVDASVLRILRWKLALGLDIG
ncbi:MAG: beta-hexosaminidase [Oscillospiraceae bacterium]|nr:beta-hexosaminidase [Oscillospiraceae bacterium]